MLRQGIYKIDQTNQSQLEVAIEPIFAIFRDGQLLGSDSQGGVYTGALDRLADMAHRDVLVGTCTVPPNGELTTGFVAGEDGATVSIIGAIDRFAANQTATVMVGDEPVTIEISYLGPLPNEARRGITRE